MYVYILQGSTLRVIGYWPCGPVLKKNTGPDRSFTGPIYKKIIKNIKSYWPSGQLNFFSLALAQSLLAPGQT